MKRSKFNNYLTRLLCLSVYYNSKLRNEILINFLNIKYKLPNESYGVNFYLLFKHAIMAQKRYVKNVWSMYQRVYKLKVR